MQLEYWFDFSCPYAYLASVKVEALAARTGAELLPRPMLLGGVFRAVGTAQNLAGTLSPAKARHNANDLSRHAKLFGAPYRMPDGHPRSTVAALRALLAAGEPFMPLAHRIFRAYWVEGRDVADAEVLKQILSEHGLDAAAILARAQSDEVKQDLRRRTDEAIAKGVFGAPALIVGGELFWGQDRMGFVEEALGGTPEAIAPPIDRLRSPVDFWFDYSSPFTYVAAERVESVLGAKARWKPMLLGGLFRAVGTPDVPLFAQSEAKRAHTAKDLDRQAKKAGAPLKWPSRFPMNTVLALRATIAAGDTADPKVRALIHALFRAFWAEDRDLADPAVVAAVATSAGFDGPALVAAASEQEVKDTLRKLTEEAAEAGAFGAPTFVVYPEGGPPSLYWGADRLEMAALAASGDARAI